jgi:hypothetical protein
MYNSIYVPGMYMYTLYVYVCMHVYDRTGATSKDSKVVEQQNKVTPTTYILKRPDLLKLTGLEVEREDRRLHEM